MRKEGGSYFGEKTFGKGVEYGKKKGLGVG